MVVRTTVCCAFCLKKQGVMQASAAQPTSRSTLPLASPRREGVGRRMLRLSFRTCMRSVGWAPASPKASVPVLVNGPIMCRGSGELAVRTPDSCLFEFRISDAWAFRLELSHPPHALIRQSLCFFLARSLVDLSGWQLVQYRRAVILEDIPRVSEWAFLLS